jgi:TPR repeat protein
MDMARYHTLSAERAPLGEAPDGDTLCQLGLQCAANATPDDRVSAHKWFNIAAMRGNAEAARLRREIADEMSPAEIACAQRAARAWLTRH